MDAKGKTTTIGWVGLLAGIWLLMAPFVLGYTNEVARTNDIWLGIIIGAAALLRSFMPARNKWFDWITIFAGVWLVIAPYMLGYANSVASMNDMVLGLVSIVVSLWSFGTATRRGGRHAHA